MGVGIETRLTMTIVSDALYRLRVLFKRRAMDFELAAELEHHVSVQAERFVATGLSAREAGRRALVDMGGVELVKENTRTVRGTLAYWRVFRHGRWWRTQLVLNNDTGSDPSRVRAVDVTTNFFTMLGVSPKIGHTFDSDSLHRAMSNEVMISERLWRTKFNSDAAIVGKSIRLNGTGFTVVGVMPASFNFPANMDVWQGLTWDLHQHSRTAVAIGLIIAGQI